MSPQGKMAESAELAETAEPPLDIPRHLKYWKMCLSPLPHHYLPNEGNRLALAYFIVNSIIILTPPETPASQQLIPPRDRHKIRQWVLSHQHPGGGFCPSSSLVFPLHGYEQWEGETGKQQQQESSPGMANIPGTIFALQLLALMADENDPEGAFNGVDRVQTLRWLRRLQRPDGSFGEVLKQIPGKGWEILGGYDMRYCYIAASIRWMLRGDATSQDDKGWVEDFDVDGLKRYIIRSQTYDGGFAASSEEEPHAGYAYCAISALSLLDRPLETREKSHESEILNSGLRDMPGLVHWLASRQFVYIEPTASSSDDQDSESEEEDVVNFLLPSKPSPSAESRLVASNGRTNKVADTCYSWWVGAALANLTKTELFNWKATRRFLVEKMAHQIGGFSKYPGGPPDVYHSCFGLTAMAVMAEPGLRALDSALAVPVDTVKVIEKARGKLLRTARTSATAKSLVEMGLTMRGDSGKRPVWLSIGGH